MQILYIHVYLEASSILSSGAYSLVYVFRTALYCGISLHELKSTSSDADVSKYGHVHEMQRTAMCHLSMQKPNK